MFVEVLLAVALVTSAAASEYRVGEGDVLAVHVYNEPDLTRDVEVDATCQISVGLIGRLHVCDFSTKEIETEIRTRLSDGFLVSPQVIVRVADYRSQEAQVLGEVKSVGRYFLKGETTLLDLINEAGGPAAQNVAEVQVVNVDGKITRFDLGHLMVSDSVFVADGDRIQLMPGQLVYVQGEVKTEGPVTYQEGITVTQALATAGGPGEYASLRRVSILRTNGEKLHVNLNRVNQGREADVVLLPNDRLIIRRGAF